MPSLIPPNHDEHAAWADHISHTIDLLDELPDRAEEFAESVREKLESMLDYYQDHGGTFTQAQIAAAINMREGVEKWL